MSSDPKVDGGIATRVIPSKPVTLRPLIVDILDTRLCDAESVFLVEGFDESIAVGSKHRLVRLLLGDGELCIQALLAAKAHSYVDGGHIFVGCYVQVNSFEARTVDSGPDYGDDMFVAEDAAVLNDDPAARKTMVYLVIEDLLTIGWNNDYIDMVKRQSMSEESKAEESTSRMEID
ncbi:hypothetical protein P8C59_006375 [Phyllachora maydis]|uniref:Uncharacterized protein n=1 Tax=Phyllachora maydis TaxID=1825666 RepID=A0AAD9I7G7_9PEZI|nr:hypothetical protein P8C59_006375 [Phyllachora maydis]